MIVAFCSGPIAGGRPCHTAWKRETRARSRRVGTTFRRFSGSVCLFSNPFRYHLFQQLQTGPIACARGAAV